MASSLATIDNPKRHAGIFGNVFSKGGGVDRFLFKKAEEADIGGMFGGTGVPPTRGDQPADTRSFTQKLAEAPIRFAAFAKQQVQKNRQWNRVPLSFHILADLIGRIPAPILLVGCMWYALFSSAYGSSVMGNMISVKKTQNNRFLRFLKGHDAAFGIFYAMNAVSVAVMLLLLTLVARVPLTVVFGIIFSILGVVASVSMEMVCATSDFDTFKQTEAGNSAMLRRRIFLHGAMGAGIASVVLIIPSVAPKR